MSVDIHKVENALNAIAGEFCDYKIQWIRGKGYCIVQYDTALCLKERSKTKCGSLWRVLEDLSAIAHDMDV